jgi:hypothetical protein
MTATDTTTEPTTTATVTPITAPRKTPSRASRAAAQTAKPAASKTPAKSAKVTTPKAAAPKVTKTAAPKVPSKNVQRREVAEFIIKVTADALAKWNAKSHHGITAEFATETAARYLAYFPNCQWDSRLGERSLAGRRDPKSA